MFQHPDHEAIIILFSLGISWAEFSVPQLYPLNSKLKCYLMFLQLTLKGWKKIKQSQNKIKPKLKQTFKLLLKNHPVKTEQQEILICKKTDFCHLLKPQKLQLQALSLFPVKNYHGDKFNFSLLLLSELLV